MQIPFQVTVAHIVTTFFLVDFLDKVRVEKILNMEEIKVREYMEEVSILNVIQFLNLKSQ